jgi:hypothetical protein
VDSGDDRELIHTFRANWSNQLESTDDVVHEFVYEGKGMIT